MRVLLKKLQIYGFKSFAEKTQFVFDKNITAIVGPNGCGKSNIVDAIYWVFQGHSLKSLRANEKQDLIFKGNDIKPPAGFAEVELFFEVHQNLNEENLSFDNPNEEFSIKKRLYPSGEIVYYLNKKEVKPKDISEFLKKYSITSIDYSIIAQGSVSKIIDMKPEERVELIEAAAGIKNIKNERTKAFNELMKAEENLKSISLLSEELENEVNKLKIQAEKAKLYKKANDDINFADQAIQILKYRKLLENIEKLKKDFEESDEKLNKISEKTVELERLKGEINSKIKEIESIIEEKKENIYKLESEIVVIEKTILLSQKRYEELQIDRKRKVDDLEFFKNRLKKIDELLLFPIDDLKSEIEQERAKKDELEYELEKINSKISQYTQEYEKVSNEIKKLEKKIKDLYKEQEDFLNEEITNLFSNLYVARMKVINLSSKSKNSKEMTISQKNKLLSIRNRIEDLSKFGQSIENAKILRFIDELKNEFDLIFNEYNLLIDNYDIIINEIDEIEKLLFGKDSIFSKFQKLNDEINQLDEQIDKEKNNLHYIQEQQNSFDEAKRILIKRIDEINKKLYQLEEKIQNYQSNKSRYESEKIEILYNIKQKEEEIKQLEDNMEKIKQEAIKLLSEKDKIFNQKRELDSNIREYEKEIDKYRESLTKCLVENENIIREKNEILTIRESFNISKAKIETQCEAIKTSFFENYRIVLSNEILNDEKYNNYKESELRNLILESRKNLEEIGQVNFLAIDEYEEVSKRYEFILKQKQDIINTKEKILNLIAELDKNLQDKFMEAFNIINENFKAIFCEVFKGGNASMILTKPDNLFETGIDIVIQPPGKNITNISLLSGGETAMSSISLLFAFFLYKPSPFCVMDEVDAPFDENNIILFKRLIQRFAKDTQFFIISHNKLTLEIADILYGITMEEDGISKVVSVKLEDIKN